MVTSRMRDIHDTFVDERSELLRSLVVHGAHPGQAQVSDIFSVYLIERAVSVMVVGPMDHQPVRRVRIEQHCVGHGNEVLRPLLRLEGRKKTEDHDKQRRRYSSIRLPSYHLALSLGSETYGLDADPTAGWQGVQSGFRR